MTIAESAKNYLDIYNTQVFIEQFTLKRESKLFLTLPNMEHPSPVSATVSFIYDAFQTGATLYEDNILDKSIADVDTSIESEFTVKLPIMKEHPDIKALVEDISEEYPETEPILNTRETFLNIMPAKKYGIFYSYDIESENSINTMLLDEIFSELGGITDLAYKKTKNYIDLSWYRGEE